MFRFVHVVVSFILCSIVSIYNIDWLTLFIIYPFLKLLNKKFIITHLMDFIDMIWIVTCTISFLFILPLVFYHLLNFFKSSWYVYQVEILNIFIYWLLTTICIVAALCYIIFLPAMLNFFYWEKLEQSNSVLLIESEFRVLNFVYWTLSFQFSFISIVSFYLTAAILFWVLLRVNKIYFLVKLYRRHFNFISLVFLFILLPSEIFLQLFLVLFTTLFYEFVFFFVCYKVSNLN